MLSVFFSYSHEDEQLRNQLEQQLEILKRQQIVATWHDRRITAGEEIDQAISLGLESADIILLLVSPPFLASKYCYDREMLLAMVRHERKEAVVIPVILRPCEWHETPFGKLLATPTDGKPVTLWPDRDQAFLDVTRAIRAAAEKLQPQPLSSPAAQPAPAPSTMPFSAAGNLAPRSSNLRLARQFTERDKDAFKLETFDYIAHYFETSLDELQARNPGVEGTFRRIDANRFGATIYREGKAIARCTVFIGGRHFSNGIAYSATETSDSNSMNENLSVETDDQMLYLRSMGMAHFRAAGRDAKLSQEGAAEFYWSMLIEPLQHR